MTLKDRRKALGLSQEVLARLLGVSLSAWSRWEKMNEQTTRPIAPMVDLALSELKRRMEK